MADRYITWFIRDCGCQFALPSYFIDEDMEKKAVRIHADTAPSQGDCKIDILANGVSIFNNHASNAIGYNQTGVTIVPDTTVELPKGENAEEDAENFAPGDIEAGNWLTCQLINPNGARNITVILELDRTNEQDEARI